MNLSKQQCVPLSKDTPALTNMQSQELLSEISEEWAVGDTLQRTFTFNDFAAALVFTNAVGAVAEEQDHHPDIRMYDYKKVDITLATHSVGGLSQNDFIVASKIDLIGVSS